ncbi:hypothetical protein WJX79_000689 [Trebouxia sp. C0005]
MQEDLGKRQGASRYAGTRPLADLQQNVLSGPAQNLRQSYSSQTGVTPKAFIPVAGADTCNLDPVQLRLKSIGLSQYAAVFAKEEVDEEALPCLTVQDLRAVEAQKGSSTLAAAASQGAAVPAPRSRADEARQLAMALSASMGTGTDELVSSTEGLPSCAASHGVFMTMMAASRSKSVPTATVDPNPSVPPTQAFSRGQEEALLERVFMTSVAASSVPAIGPAYSPQRQPDSLSQAQAIRVSESLWARAACSDPPECQLQDRVQKRKADAEMHRQMVKRQSLEQQHAATDAARRYIVWLDKHVV